MALHELDRAFDEGDASHLQQGFGKLAERGTQPRAESSCQYHRVEGLSSRHVHGPLVTWVDAHIAGAIMFGRLGRGKPLHRSGALRTPDS